MARRWMPRFPSFALASLFWAGACDNKTTGTGAPDTSVSDQETIAADDSAQADSAAPDTTSADGTTTTATDTEVAPDTSPYACPPCVSNEDCPGAVCAQAGLESVCAPVCGAGDTCLGSLVCALTTTVAGEQASVCLPPSGPCAAPNDQPDPPVGETCGTMVGPDVAAQCHSCGGSGNCQTNGCYGGWWCDTSNKKCHAPPSGCEAATGIAYDGGAAVTGTVDKNGGTVSRLYFAVVGDTRPPTADDTAGYPSAVIGKIYQDLEALAPRPPFAIATGDYVFAKVHGGEAAAQLDLYLAARAAFSGVVFPAIGNHECTGYTSSNCGEGTTNGRTNNYLSFVDKMLGPIGRSDPYYAFDVKAADDSWTAKFVVVAANAWTTAQADWLETELARPTTYTFIVRHEPKDANTAPGVDPSEAIMARHPHTLAITGHSHTYYRSGPREIIVGNGGAPLTGSKNFGFAAVSQRADQTIAVDMIDYSTGKADSRFHFVLKPDGSAP